MCTNFRLRLSSFCTFVESMFDIYFSHCNRKYILIYILFSLISVYSVNCQTNTDYRAIGDAKVASDLFNSQNYRMALEEYKIVHEWDTTNIIVNHHLALCYLNTNIDKKKAIPLLKYITSKEECNPQAWYDLGRAYRYVLRLNEAIEAFKKFESQSKEDEKNYITASRQIEMCENALELMKKPINISFKNLGPLVNSPYPDFNPCVSGDESNLFFSSKRKGNLGSYIDFDGYSTADIYYSKYIALKWNKAKRLSPLVNTPYIEECTGVSADGNTLLLFVANQTAVNDVLISQKKGRSFLRAVSPGPNINQIETSEYAASISPDKKQMFFSSDRPGGMGGKDIYYSIMLPSGDWGPARNAGEIINTEYDEDFPYLAPDDSSFYFCSLGHNSMGGYDIFRSVWDTESHSYSRPVNMGYPLNTPSDNMCISFSESGRHAYVSMFMEDGFGDLDIYRVTFNDVEAAYTVIKCVILESDSSQIENPEKIIINIANLKSGTNTGKYSPNKETGWYTIVLTPGDYKLEASDTGYLPYTEEISIRDRGSETNYIIKKIILNKEK